MPVGARNGEPRKRFSCDPHRSWCLRSTSFGPWPLSPVSFLKDPTLVRVGRSYVRIATPPSNTRPPFLIQDTLPQASSGRVPDAIPGKRERPRPNLFSATKPLLSKGVLAILRRQMTEASSATAPTRSRTKLSASIDWRIFDKPGSADESSRVPATGEPNGDQEPLRRRMMDLVVGRDRRSTPKLDNRDGRGHYLRQVRDVGRGAQSRHIGAEKAPCTALLRNCRS
jgi:hypothetical protein